MSDNSSKVDLKNHDHSAFSRGAGKTREVLWYIAKVCFFLTAIPFPSRFKVFLLRLFGSSMGRGIIIRPRVNIQMPWKLSVGDHSWIGEEAFLLNFDEISIGSNVCISQRAFLCAGNHDFRNPKFPFRPSRIRLEDGVWIGAGASVGPDVSVGTDAVVALGAVVRENLEANGIYGGNPAVFISGRFQTPT